MTKRNLLPLILLLVFTLTACAPREAAATPPPSPTATPAPTPSPTPEPTPTPDPIQEQIDAMTEAEKVGQLLIAGFYGTEPGADVTSYIQDYHVGGVILYGRNIESADQLLALTNGLKALNGGGIPLFISTDQEGGRVDRMPQPIPRTPSAYKIEDPVFYGGTLAAACAAFGLNLDYAPSLDIWSNPDNTVIGDRAFGSDAATVAERGPAAALAMAKGGIISVVKHFPGHGDTDVDSHAGLPTVDKSLAELEELELVPFRAALEEDLPAVMVAHILMKALDPDKPASLSPAVVDGLLRGEMGFDGVVFTDDLTMGAVTQNYGLGEACVLAVEAGCDVLLVCHETGTVDEAYQALMEAVESGRISRERLDLSVSRILRLKAEYGLKDTPLEKPNLDALNARIIVLALSIPS